MTRSSAALGAAALLASLLLPRLARASNQETLPLGTEASLTGSTVAARSGDGGAIWYNPAGLAAADGTSLDVSASAFLLRIYDLPNAAQVREGGSLFARDASFREIVSVPSALSFVRRLSPELVGGFGVFVAEHEDLATSIEVSDVSGPPSYGATIAVSRRLSDYYAGPSLGLSLSPGLRLGLSLFGSYHTLRTSRDFRSDYAAPEGSGVTRSVLAVERRTDRRLFGARLHAGLQVDPTPELHLGLVLRSPEMILVRFEEVDAGRETTLLADGAAPVVSTESQLVPTEEGTFEALRPLRVTGAISRDFRWGWLGLEADVEPPLRNATLEIERTWVWNLRVGGRYRLSEHLGLGAGLFTDRSPSGEPQVLGATHIDFYGGCLGVEMGNERKLVPDPEHPEGRIRFLTTISARYARGRGEIGGLLFDPLAAPEDVVADVTIHELSGHIGTMLAF